VKIDPVPAGAEDASFASAARMIAALRPSEPVYCVYGAQIAAAVRRFKAGFAGDVLYAVKANPAPAVLGHLWAAGIRDFDTASIAEIALVRDLLPAARCYYMAPVRPVGAAEEAYHRFGLRDFALDTAEEFDRLRMIVQAPRETTLYIRLATPGTAALYELSSKFGAGPEEAAQLLQQAHALGFKIALTFHVGSQCSAPEAYSSALTLVAGEIARAGVPICAIDVGGGFPAAYPGSDAAPLEAHLSAIARSVAALGLPSGTRLMAEPGRVLCAEGLSLVAQVALRHRQKLYLNDGIYGSFAELKLAQGAIALPSRCFRPAGGPEAQRLGGPPALFTVYGPTCDSYDVFPLPVALPEGIETGDYIEFGMMGAYSIAMRTAFNGFFPDRLVEIGPAGTPPPG
jgi:ornithine decarboxylase